MTTLQEIEFRVRSLEQWRDKVDEDRGVIMGELGEIRGTQQAILAQLTALSDKLDDRPSRVEMEAMQKKSRSLFPALTKMEVEGPWNLKFKLFGVSGITIVVVLSVIAAATTLLLLGRK